MLILAFAPLLAILWEWLRKRNREPSAPRKMVFGYVLLAVGFGFATLAGFRSETHLLVSPIWFVATDLFRSWGELLLSPVGLSYVTKVAPARYGSRLMAAWFLAEGLGNKVAGSLAAYSDVIRAGDFYAIFVAIAVVSTIALLAVIPLLKRLAVGCRSILDGTSRSTTMDESQAMENGVFAPRRSLLRRRGARIRPRCTQLAADDNPFVTELHEES